MPTGYPRACHSFTEENEDFLDMLLKTIGGGNEDSLGDGLFLRPQKG